MNIRNILVAQAVLVVSLEYRDHHVIWKDTVLFVIIVSFAVDIKEKLHKVDATSLLDYWNYLIHELLCNITGLNESPKVVFIR